MPGPVDVIFAASLAIAASLDGTTAAVAFCPVVAFKSCTDVCTTAADDAAVAELASCAPPATFW